MWRLDDSKDGRVQYNEFSRHTSASGEVVASRSASRDDFAI